MTPDPILEEVRTIREQLADQFQFDIRKIIEDTQRRQALSNNKIVSFERPKITLRQADENKTSPFMIWARVDLFVYFLITHLAFNSLALSMIC